MIIILISKTPDILKYYEGKCGKLLLCSMIMKVISVHNKVKYQNVYRVRRHFKNSKILTQE